MTKILWKASASQIKKSNLYRYEKFLKINYKTKKIKNYKSLLNWSIKKPKYFWNSIWDFAKVYGIKKEKIKLSKNLYQSKFLLNSKLNFAENMFRKKTKIVSEKHILRKHCSKKNLRDFFPPKMLFCCFKF